MKRFKFRLEAVLDQRNRIEKMAKTSFAEAEMALRRAQQLMAELEEVRAAILEELGQKRLSGGFCPDETRLYQEYLTTIKKCISDQHEYVRELTTNAEALRLNLVGASKNRQIVDKLKERDHGSHVSEVNRIEQAAADEMASMRHQFQRHTHPRLES